MMRLWQFFFVAFISLIDLCPAVVLAEPEITKIGVMLPLSGETMRSGRELQRGLELVARERDSLRYFVFEDIGNSDPSKLQAAAERLLQMQVDIVLLARTDDALAVYSLFAQKQVPLVVLLDSNDQVQVESPLLYSSGYSTEYAADLIARFTRYNRQARRVIVITDSTRSAGAAATAFEDVFRADPAILVTREDYAAVMIAGASFTARLRDEAVEAVYAPLTASKVRQVSALLPSGGTNPVLLTGDYVDRDALANPAFGAIGLFVTLPWVDEEGTLGTSYRETYEGEPVDLSVVSVAHEAGGMVLTAVQESESLQVPLVNRLDPLWPTDRSLRKPARLYEAHGTVIQQLTVVEPQIESPVPQTTASVQQENTPEQITVAVPGQDSPQGSTENGSHSETLSGETTLIAEDPVAVPPVTPATAETGAVLPSGQAEEAAVVTPQPASAEPAVTPVNQPTPSEEPAYLGTNGTVVPPEQSSSSAGADVAGGGPQASGSAQNDGFSPSDVTPNETGSGVSAGSTSFDNLANQGF